MIVQVNDRGTKTVIICVALCLSADKRLPKTARACGQSICAYLARVAVSSCIKLVTIPTNQAGNAKAGNSRIRLCDGKLLCESLLFG